MGWWGAGRGAGPCGTKCHRCCELLKAGARGQIAEEEASWMEDYGDSTASRQDGQALSLSGLPPPWLELHLVGVVESSPWVPKSPTSVGGLAGLDLGS